MWVVVQEDRMSRQKLYACFAQHEPGMSNYISAWTARPADGKQYSREEAVQERRIRMQNGHHLRGWSLHIEEVM